MPLYYINNLKDTLFILAKNSTSHYSKIKFPLFRPLIRVNFSFLIYISLSYNRRLLEPLYQGLCRK
jgi:hypothetical protein